MVRGGSKQRGRWAAVGGVVGVVVVVAGDGAWLDLSYSEYPVPPMPESRRGEGVGDESIFQQEDDGDEE